MISFTITNKHRPTATIVMLVSFYGKQYRKSIGIGLPTLYWNEKKKCARTTADFHGEPINDAIDRWREIGKQAVKHFTTLRQVPSSAEFAIKLNELSNLPDDDIPNIAVFFCDYLEHTYIPRYHLVRRAHTVKKYHTALHKLKEYETHTHHRLKFSDIGIDFYNNFQHWFFTCGFSANYFGNIIKIIKQVFRESRTHDKIHTFDGTDHRDFIAPKEAADTVYLNEEELQIIRRLDICSSIANDTTHPLSEENALRRVRALERARNLFLIGCYTGLRVSDFSRLREAHVGRHISIKTTKTGANIVIPIHPVVREIIEKGFDLSTSISDQKLNDHIKELCRLAGFTEEIMVNKNIGGKNMELIVPKYKLISSHTARRSFATNAYKAGVPTIAIMKITGHTKESTFLKYIRVSAEENAELLSQHPFFMLH